MSVFMVSLELVLKTDHVEPYTGEQTAPRVVAHL